MQGLTLSEKAKKIVKRLKDEYGVSDEVLRPLLEELQFKAESSQEQYLIVLKKILEAGGTLDRNTFLKVLSKESDASKPRVYYIMKFIYRVYGEENEVPNRREVLPKSVRRQKEILEPEEVLLLIKQAKKENPYTRLLFVLSTVYGLRRVEMFNLSKSDINTDKWTFFVMTAKGGEPREHLIPENLRIYFMDFINYRGSKKYSYVQELNWDFNVVAANAGIRLRSRLGWHSIRRALITELMKTDLNPMIIRNFLRWKPRTPDILMEYVLYNPLEVDKTVFRVHPFLGEW